jgi:inorganic pyrophosphatase
MRHIAAIAVALISATGLAAQPGQRAPATLPAHAVATLSKSLAAAEPVAQHIWRDTPPFNHDGTLNGYVEIARGDRQKWEFDMRTNRRAIDRVLPESVGGYPVNYGFVPQTVSYDGDPFDVLVLGPPVEGGTVVRGVIVGVMRMEDEKGLDSKVVISRTGAGGRPLHALTPDDQRRIGGYFARYKQHEAGKFSKVSGWGGAAEGRSYVTTTHAFFRTCRALVDRPCELTTTP